MISAPSPQFTIGVNSKSSPTYSSKLSKSFYLHFTFYTAIRYSSNKFLSLFTSRGCNKVFCSVYKTPSTVISTAAVHHSHRAHLVRFFKSCCLSLSALLPCIYLIDFYHSKRLLTSRTSSLSFLNPAAGFGFAQFLTISQK